MTGQEIRRRRESRNWTRYQLRRASGVSISTIVRVETGKGNPSDEILSRLTKALDGPEVMPGDLEIGRALYCARKEYRLRREAVALRAGIPVEHLRDIERGDRGADEATQGRIRAAIDDLRPVQMTPDRLVAIMGERGLTVADVARDMRATADTVRAWITGTRPLPQRADVVIPTIEPEPVEVRQEAERKKIHLTDSRPYHEHAWYERRMLESHLERECRPLARVLTHSEADAWMQMPAARSPACCAFCGMREENTHDARSTRNRPQDRRGALVPVDGGDAPDRRQDHHQSAPLGRPAGRAMGRGPEARGAGPRRSVY